MSMWNRAAQFAPFAALTGYDDAIRSAEGAQESDRTQQKLNPKAKWSYFGIFCLYLQGKPCDCDKII